MDALHMLWQQPLFLALEQALIGFLWQGAAVALAVAALLALLPQRASRARYATACLGLLTMAALPAVSFLTTLAEASRAMPAADLGGAGTLGTVTLVASMSGPTAGTPWADVLRPWLLPAWCVGVLFLSLRTLLAWRRTLRLSELDTREPAPAWREALEHALKRMRMAGPVRLRASSSIDVPMVIGLWRPLILVPAGALCGLSPTQLEAILAHELAHIRRHDYLVNLLQSLVETLLFYHPAVWWLSHRIREEREHCADDLAVQCCGDAYLYARALAQIEQLRVAPQPALGAGGGSLLTRVRRLLVTAEPAAPRRPWRLASGVGGALLMALLGASQLPETAHAELTAPTPAPAEPVAEESPAPPQRAAAPRLLVAPPSLSSPRTPVARPPARALPKVERAAALKVRAPRSVPLLIPDTQSIARTELPRVPYTLDAEPSVAEPSPQELVVEVQPVGAPPQPQSLPTATAGVITLGPGITPPRFISGERLHYPNLSYAARAQLASRPQGSVVTRCTITTEGSVTDCKPIKGLEGLEDAVIRTLSTWRYEPALREGKPVAVEYVFDIWFTSEPGGGMENRQQLARADMSKVVGAAAKDSCIMCARFRYNGHSFSGYGFSGYGF
ncbi:MAG TPA: M56 family metallopeptidase [Myxococcus sp.]|nr:M56 family metallopeptidase [Myxococcus sp.]